MDIDRELLGQFLFCGFHGTTLDKETVTFFQRIKPGGILLFKRNIVSLDQLVHLCFSLHNLYDPPPLLAIDQEGGMVHRLSSILPETPDAYTLARYGSDELVETLGSLIGQALRIIGIDVNFAPVLDLSHPDAPNGIGKRSFGLHPAVVITMGGAFLRGILGEGVAGTLKHFPGLGSSTIDSHEALPTITKKKTFLEGQDMKPFEILSPISPVIMMGHAYYPSLSIERVPATLSSVIIRDFLRKKYSFQGVILTDDMEMGALRSFLSSGEEAIRALKAGCDMVLYCSSLEMVQKSYEKIISSMENQVLDKDDMGRSLRRIFEVKQGFIVREKKEQIKDKMKKITEKMKRLSDKIFSSL